MCRKLILLLFLFFCCVLVNIRDDPSITKVVVDESQKGFVNISVVDEVQSYPYFVNISLLVEVQSFQYDAFINKTPETSSYDKVVSPSCRRVEEVPKGDYYYPGKA